MWQICLYTLIQLPREAGAHARRAGAGEHLRGLKSRLLWSEGGAVEEALGRVLLQITSLTVFHPTAWEKVEIAAGLLSQGSLVCLFRCCESLSVVSGSVFFVFHDTFKGLTLEDWALWQWDGSWSSDMALGIVVPLAQCFSTFLMLWPFNIVPYISYLLIIKLFLLLL